MWANVIPTSAAIAFGMAAAHWAPTFEGSHTLWRYVWGMGWIAAGVISTYFLVPGLSASNIVIAFLLYVACAGVGTVAVYGIDKFRALLHEVERKR